MKKTISFSAIKLYLMCARKWGFQYIEKKPSLPSGPMIQSSVIHSVVEKDLQNKLETGNNLSIEDKLDIFHSLYKEVLEANNVMWGRHSPEDLRVQAIDIITLHHEFVAINLKPELIEYRFAIPLNEEWNLTGVFDVVEEDGSLADLKVFSKTPSQTELDKDLQLSLYAYAYRQLFGEVEKELRWDCIVKTKNLKLARLTTSRSTQEIEWTLKLVEEVVSAMEKQIAFPNPTGWWCAPNMCAFYDECQTKGV